MNIIIEGADLTGKTTLVKAITNKLGWASVHLSKPSSTFTTGTLCKLLAPQVVYDRFELSEVVYRAIDNEVGYMNQWQLMALQQIKYDLGIVTVVLYAMDHDTITNRLSNSNDRNEMFTLSQILEANEMFAEMATNKCINVNGAAIDLCIDIGAPIESLTNEATLDYLITRILHLNQNKTQTKDICQPN